MKTLTLLIFLFTVSFAVSAQDTKYEFCTVQSIGKFSGGTKVKVDFGTAPLSEEKKKLKEGFEKNIGNNIDALNEMSRYGWEYVESYTLDVSMGQGSQLFFLFRKPVRK